jgi:hypothetical protein
MVIIRVTLVKLYNIYSFEGSGTENPEPEEIVV